MREAGPPADSRTVGATAMGNPTLIVINFLCILLNILQYAIIARALMSWIPNLSPDNRIVMILNEITEPVIGPLRSVIPRVGMIDISSLVALILLQVLTRNVLNCGWLGVF